MEDADAPFQKITISGPTLAALIQRSISSPCDLDGLLLGHVARRTNSSLCDDDSSPSTSHFLVPTVISAVSSSHTLSFYDPLGRVSLPSLRRLLPASATPAGAVVPNSLIGFFVSRRNTPLRPSMREVSISISLLSQTLALADKPDEPLSSFVSPSSPPSIFFLISSSSSDALSIYTHEYRAFQLRRRSGAGGSADLDPCSVEIINIGPAFHGQYDEFCPSSPFPWLPVARVGDGGEDERSRESLSWTKQATMDQRVLNSCAQGFEVERLGRLLGPAATNYTSELEDLYGKMLEKLESLARAVEKSSARVVEQESRNIKLRWKVAGSD